MFFFLNVMIANVNVFAEKKLKKKKAIKELLEPLYCDTDNTFSLTPWSKTNLKAISFKFGMSNDNILAV